MTRGNSPGSCQGRLARSGYVPPDPAAPELEARFTEIRDEVLALDGTRFHRESERIGRTGDWDVAFLYERGRRHDDVCAACPVTARAIETHRTIRTVAGLIYVSRMRPGTHISAHRGPTNLRLRCHLAIVVPEGDCAIRVGTQSGPWRQGKCLVFDDSHDHEAWNHTDQDRIVLIVDLWHPGLSDAEVRLLQGLHAYTYRHARRLERAGIEILETRLTHLAYAPEIAEVMLRRQQAEAILAARRTMVQGAVAMVQMALSQLADSDLVELDPERKATMVSNLMVVLSGDHSPTPEGPAARCRYADGAVFPAPQPPSDGGRATSFIIWLAAFALFFGAFVVLAGSARERKPRFWLRVVALPLVPTLIAAMLVASRALRVLPDGVAATLLMTLVFLTIPAIMLVPALLYRNPGSSPDSSDDDGGGGPGPGSPPARPTPPRGGVPLPDAEQSRTRIRDHRRRVFAGSRARRPAREPDRAPVRGPVPR